MDFLQAKTDLLDIVNRPATEPIGTIGSTSTMSDVAGREINNAIRWANRHHSFKYAEARLKYLYTASTFSVSISAISADIIGFIGVELGANSSADFGDVLNLRSLDKVTRSRLEYARKNNSGNSETNPYQVYDYATYVKNVGKYEAFIQGYNFGLYPTPTVECNLILQYNALLPFLVLTTDTNFMLTFGYDFILSFAAKRMNIYLKDDDRTPVNQESLKEDWQSMLTWDSIVRAGTNQEIGGF